MADVLFWRISTVLHHSTKMMSRPLPEIAFQGRQQAAGEIQRVFQALRTVLQLQQSSFSCIVTNQRHSAEKW
jgi:hypothetical protein